MFQQILIVIALAMLLQPTPGLTGETPPQHESRACPFDPSQALIPAGEFWMGSTRAEREYAYRLDNQVTRPYGWYERETRKKAKTGVFCIDRYPVTISEYKKFIDDSGRTAPFIDPEAYERQGFLVHAYEKVKEFLWSEGSFPVRRENHPVVLVSLDDARSYCTWSGQKKRRRYRLPSELEWEKAARGTAGTIFPWGNEWNSDYLNSGERFGTTTPVNRFPRGKSPYGLYDMVGNVFEWTDSQWDTDKFVLKGCSWDDLPGTCRAAMRHGRPAQTKHILIGFRCASDADG